MVGVQSVDIGNVGIAQGRGTEGCSLNTVDVIIFVYAMLCTMLFR